LRRLLLVALALVACGACKLDVAVAVDTRADGRGDVQVTAVLDREAARMMGDVDERLRTADLRRAGWEVDAPEVRSDGSVEVVVRHGFAGPGDAQRVLADVAGDGGPFRGFVVRQRHTFWRTTTSFAGTVDLGKGIEAFADTELARQLGGGPALGVPVDQLERRLGGPVDRLFGLQVSVRLPGKVEESNAPTEGAGGAVWSPKLGEQASLQATAAQWNARNIALLAVAVAAALAAVGVAAVRRLRRRA
jgi:hypothetical protein